MTNIVVLSNNPLLLQEPGEYPVRPVDGNGLTAVLSAASDLAQSGYKLLSTPLPPNVPLIRAPYRSLLMMKNNRQYDAQGLEALEKAKERLELLGQSAYNEKQAQDAAFIDRELLLRGLTEIRQAV